MGGSRTTHMGYARGLLLAVAAAAIAAFLQGCGIVRRMECTNSFQNCMKTGCCRDPNAKCYQRDEYWASCKADCEPGYTNKCDQILPGGKIKPAPTTTRTTTTLGADEKDSAELLWEKGTWTTGYWDCCKPSCSWNKKGKVNAPVKACSADTGEVLTDHLIGSVCQGGLAATCVSNQPFKYNTNLSMAFAAAAVSGDHGLTGDENCGQCFELKFTKEKHGSWGGAHPDLLHKRMVVQVTNIGKDVKGDHSFDIMIPGAGQGIFTKGCTAQFPRYSEKSFDCGKNYGGCEKKADCKKLPEELRDGCEWRFDWYKWKAANGKTNNPFVWFRRVRCPIQLTEISGSIPLDDAMYDAVEFTTS